MAFAYLKRQANIGVSFAWVHVCGSYWYVSVIYFRPYNRNGTPAKVGQDSDKYHGQVHLWDECTGLNLLAPAQRYLTPAGNPRWREGELLPNQTPLGRSPVRRRKARRDAARTPEDWNALLAAHDGSDRGPVQPSTN